VISNKYQSDNGHKFAQLSNNFMTKEYDFMDFLIEDIGWPVKVDEFVEYKEDEDKTELVFNNW